MGVSYLSPSLLSPSEVAREWFGFAPNTTRTQGVSPSRLSKENYSASVSRQGLTCFQLRKDSDAMHTSSTQCASAIEIRECDRFITVWTYPARSNPSAEHIAVWTSTSTAAVALTTWTLMNDLKTLGTSLRTHGTRAIASPIRCLATMQYKGERYRGDQFTTRPRNIHS